MKRVQEEIVAVLKKAQKKIKQQANKERKLNGRKKKTR